MRKYIPYWLEHAFVSLCIFVVVSFLFGINAGLTAGVSFYFGREYTQWEMLGHFDWKGLLSPLVACLSVWAVCKLI